MPRLFEIAFHVSDRERSLFVRKYMQGSTVINHIANFVIPFDRINRKIIKSRYTNTHGR